MDKTGCFLAGVITGAVALGATAFIVESDDFGWGRSSLPTKSKSEISEESEEQSETEDVESNEEKVAN